MRKCQWFWTRHVCFILFSLPVSESVLFHFSRIYIVHDEVKDKAFELELSWVGESKNQSVFCFSSPCTDLSICLSFLHSLSTYCLFSSSPLQSQMDDTSWYLKMFERKQRNTPRWAGHSRVHLHHQLHPSILMFDPFLQSCDSGVCLLRIL